MRFTGRLAQVNASPVPATAGRSIRRLGTRGWIHTSPHFLCPRDRSQGRRELSGRVRRYEQHARAAHAEPFSALVIEAGDDDARAAASCDEDALGVARAHVPGMIEGHRSILAAFRLRLGAVRALRWPPLTCHSVMSVARGSTLLRSRLRQLSLLILLSPFVCRFVVQAHRDAAVTAASTAAASEPRRMARHQSRNVVKS